MTPGPGYDRWNFLLPTLEGLSARRVDLLRGGLTVVVNETIGWTKRNRADVWATDMVVSRVGKFPPGLVVWGPPESRAAFLTAGLQYHILEPNAVLGPGSVPRPADAFFLALDLVCTRLGAKKVRVVGARGWTKPEVRWKRWALAKAMRTAGEHGIEIERLG